MATGDGEAAGYGPGDTASDRGGRGVSCLDDGGVREAAVGRRGRGGRDAAQGARQWSASGKREARGTGRRGVRGDAIGTRGARSRQRLKAALSAWRVAATRQRRAATRARRGPRRLTSGARLSVIFELKFSPKEISSN
jgi:hypothetical protein